MMIRPIGAYSPPSPRFGNGTQNPFETLTVGAAVDLKWPNFIPYGGTLCAKGEVEKLGDTITVKRTDLPPNTVLPIRITFDRTTGKQTDNGFWNLYVPMQKSV